MVKRILCLMAALAVIMTLFAGCSANGSKDATMQDAKYRGESDSNTSYLYDNEGEKQSAADERASTEEKSLENASTKMAIAGSSGETPQASVNAILAQRKVIRNAFMTVEVDDFDAAYMSIKSMISGFGFIQEANIKSRKIYVDSGERLVKTGTIIIRIDKDKFDGIMSDVKGLGLILDENIKSDDVTDKFFDTESRLRLLRYEEGRLEEYLNKINDPDIIFKTESRLTDIRHEIERLTGTLKKWNDLVELSTITLSINEKTPDSMAVPPKEKTYFEKLSGNFFGSFKGVIRFCGDFMLFLAQALPVLVLLLLISLAALIVYRKFLKKHLNKVPDERKGDDTHM